MVTLEELKHVTIANKNGMELTILNYGARITNLSVPNKQKGLTNVVLGFEDINRYITEARDIQTLNLGASIGRFAGRISKEKITIDNSIYRLNQNTGVQLHGGIEGFGEKIWSIESISIAAESQVILSYNSPHLEEGFPGNLTIHVTYKLTTQNTLEIIYEAITDHTTIVNLTNHSYFNLSGKGSIIGHELSINSDTYLEVDWRLIPTGKIIPSKNTRFDLNHRIKINEQNFKGFDDTFILNKSTASVIYLYSNETGIGMTAKTNQNAVVVFAPKHLPNKILKQSSKSAPFPAICFETQNFPDSPHNSHFPQALLKPNEIYKNKTIFGFTVKND